MAHLSGAANGHAIESGSAHVHEIPVTGIALPTLGEAMAAMANHMLTKKRSYDATRKLPNTSGAPKIQVSLVRAAICLLTARLWCAMTFTLFSYLGKYETLSNANATTVGCFYLYVP